MVEVEVSAHQEVSRVSVGTCKGTASCIVRHLGLISGYDGVHQVDGHKCLQTICAVDAEVQRLVKFVVHVVCHLVYTTLVSLKVL